MKIGIMLPTAWHRGIDPDAVADAARACEVAGFDSVWVGDHLVTPLASDPGPEGKGKQVPSNILESFTVLGYLAGVTTTIGLGASVIVAPYRHPVLLAKMVATLDRLSRGRVLLGLGTGWMEAEFDALGVPFDERGPRTDECLAALRAAWSDDDQSFHGDYVSFSGIRMAPGPVQRPHPPLWIGGRSRRAARRAVQAGAAWHPAHWSLEQLAQHRVWLDEEAQACGRETPPLTFRTHWNLEGVTVLGASGLSPTTGEAVAQLHRLEEIGVTHLVVEVPASDDVSLLEGVARFSADVLASYREGTWSRV